MRWAALLAALLAACSGSPALNQTNPCLAGPPNDAPNSCPTPQPSYATDVLPVLEARCLLCHTPTEPDGGPNPKYPAPFDLSTYALQFQLRGTIATWVLTCKMPNLDAGATPLDEAERVILLDWLTCGAPDN